MNKVILVGRVSKVNEIKVFDSGSMNIQFSVCTSRPAKKNGKWVDVPTFHVVKAWNKDAEYIQNHVRKGDLGSVIGSLQIDEYEANGEKRRFSYINLEKFDRLLKAKPKESQINETENYNNENVFHDGNKAEANFNFSSEDIPF